MVTIQDIGLQILGDNPGKFYVFGGSEYGIKEKYISILKDKYGNQVEAASVKDVVDMLSKKHIVPLKPAVYVIRYDEGFVSDISELLASKIAKLKFQGTIVCIYEASKHITKIDKYLPDVTVSIDSVSPQFVVKYLRSDFPKLSQRFINIAVQHGDNYNQSRNMCRCMNSVSEESLNSMTDDEVARLFGCSDVSTEAHIRLGVASKQFKYLIDTIENYDDDGDRVLYAILQTMIELDKVLDNSRVQSDIKDYAKYWSREDVYHMFMNTYQELKKRRSGTTCDIQYTLIYLFGLLKFKPIPSPEVMNS